MRKVSSLFLLSLLILIPLLTACPSSTPNGQPPAPEAKNPPMLAGLWLDETTSLELCGGTGSLSSSLALQQTQGKADVTGTLTLVFSDGSFDGPFTGKVNDSGVLTGKAMFDGNDGLIPFEVAVTLKDSKLTGAITDKGPYRCDNGSSSKAVFKVELEKDADTLEPNNTVAQASALEFGKEYALKTKSKDADWFIFTLKTIHTVTFTYSDKGDYFDGVNYTLLNDKQSVLRSQDYISDSSALTAIMQPGTYYFKAQGNRGLVSYSLKVEAKEINDAEYEPNDTLEQATSIPSGFTDEFFLYDLDYYGDDTDTFKFTLSEDSVINVDLGSASTINYLTYQLFEAGHEDYTYYQSYQNKVQRALSAGTYYLRVKLSGANVSQAYNFSFTVDAIPDKTYEPNNSLNSPTLITLPFSESLFISKGDEDWYTFNLSKEQLVSMRQFGDQQLNHDLQAELYNAAGEAVSIFSLDNYTKNAAHVLPAGSYFLKISHFSPDVFFIYGLTIESEDIPDVALEPNNSLASATPIILGFNQVLVIDYDDSDWFKFTLGKTTQLKLMMEYLSDDYGGLQLINGSGNFMQSFGEGVAQPVLAGGTYYLLVQKSSGAAALKYQLSIDEK